MKFKVGDKVKFIKKIHNHSSKVKLGQVYTIDHIDNIGDGIPYLTKENKEWFKEDELELVKTAQFTKSDLKDGDIVTYRNGEKRTLLDNRLFDSNIGITNWLSNYNEDLTREYEERKDTDIIKVERSVQYKTVYERKEEILDEAEKRYLRDVIRPFRDKVGHIRKQNFFRGDYITINVKHDDGEEGIDLPYFNKNTIYKGMKLDNKYTLEELRTIKE